MRVVIQKYTFYIYNQLNVLVCKIYSKDVKKYFDSIEGTVHIKRMETRDWLRKKIIASIGLEDFNRLIRNLDINPNTGEIITSNVTRVLS